MSRNQAGKEDRPGPATATAGRGWLCVDGVPALAGALLVVVALWAAAARDPLGHWAVLFDNAHWTLAYAFAALMAWRSPGHPEADPWTRRGLTLALTCMAAGQLVWDLQAAIGWTPFPAPSDGIFLGVGLFTLHAMGRLIWHLPPQTRRLAALDVGGFTVAGLALLLVLYLPSRAGSTPLQLVMLIAYPALLLSASAAALVAQLYLRLRWTVRGVALLAGLAGLTVTWMTWNAGLLDGEQPNGGVVNLWFSVCVLVMGWGTARWRLQAEHSPRFDRLCEGITRQVPLAMVAMTVAAVAMLVLERHLPDLVRGTLILLAALALLSAPVRQSLQLGERDRMLAAERGLAESRARLEYLAHHDALTGLANLTRLRETAQGAIAAAAQTGPGVGVALLFIDLDQFKEVNDTLGHATGDALLQHTARKLQEIVRPGSTVCRYGGDEFAIVMPDVGNLGEVVHLAERIMKLGASSAAVEGHELPMSMSVGISIYPHDAADFEQLMQCADTAMYSAKDAGRNGFRFYDAQMSVEAAERVQMRGRLAHACERGEMLLHYQPVIDLRTGRIAGAEALLRWQHPELGMVSPATFIPVAESSGAILQIGAWVLREACRQCAEWRAGGLALPGIAVNLSVLQFRRGDLEKTVIEALADSGLPAHCLELEVTESVLVEERDRVTATLERLRAIGVRVAIDDFGTGYCNIGYLKSLPAAKLKMDQSLTRDITGNARDAGLARAVVHMARELGLTTVAEGVEHRAQRDLLEGFGCELAQGYLFSKPLDAAGFGALLGEETTLRVQSA